MIKITVTVQELKEAFKIWRLEATAPDTPEFEALSAEQKAQIDASTLLKYLLLVK